MRRIILPLLLLVAFGQMNLLAQVPNTCTDQASCLASAQSKYATTLATGTTGGTSKFMDSASGKGWYLLPKYPNTLNWTPQPTSTTDFYTYPHDNLPSDWAPTTNAWSVPADGSGYLTAPLGLPHLDFSKGFTVMVNAFIDPKEWVTGFQSYIVLYVQRPSKGINPTYIALGRNGTKWGVQGTTSTPPVDYRQAYVEYPWDATGVASDFQEVFFTFSPDGKLEIDVFHGQDWESSLLDFGAMMNGAPAPGTPTSNPTSYTFAPIDNGVIGITNVYISPINSGVNHMSFFSSPLSSKEAAAWAYNASGKTWHNYPCNTGYELNFDPPIGKPPVESVDNACGYSSNWLRPTP